MAALRARGVDGRVPGQGRRGPRVREAREPAGRLRGHRALLRDPPRRTGRRLTPEGGAAGYRWVVLAVGMTAQASISAASARAAGRGAGDPLRVRPLAGGHGRAARGLHDRGRRHAPRLGRPRRPHRRAGGDLHRPRGGRRSARPGVPRRLGHGAWRRALGGGGVLGSSATPPAAGPSSRGSRPTERGFALGLRHMATPLGGATAAALLPLAAHAGGVPAVMLSPSPAPASSARSRRRSACGGPRAARREREATALGTPARPGHLASVPGHRERRARPALGAELPRPLPPRGARLVGRGRGPRARGGAARRGDRAGGRRRLVGPARQPDPAPPRPGAGGRRRPRARRRAALGPRCRRRDAPDRRRACS